MHVRTKPRYNARAGPQTYVETLFPKESVVNQLSGVLKHKGYFIIDGAESLNGLNHSLKYIEPSVYNKTKE